MLNFTFQLLRLFAQGMIPATVVQILAEAACNDGWGETDDFAKKLASIGKSGFYSANCLRDLLRLTKKIGLDEASPEPYHVDVPGVGGVRRSIGVLLPHEYVGKIAAKLGHDKFRVNEESWNADFGVGKMITDWGEAVGVDSREALGIGLHADGVSYTTSQRVGHSKSCLVASWNIISAELDAHRGLRNLFFAINKAFCCDCGCEGHHTRKCVQS